MMARKQRTPRKSTRTSKTTSKRKPDDQTVITIRTLIHDSLVEQKVSRQAPIVRLAEEWTYFLRSRMRWADDADLRLSVRDRALGDLERIGVPRAFMKKLATASHVEVELHSWDAADPHLAAIHEAASDVPWEYLISSGTRGVGRFQTLLVTRLYRNGAPAVIPKPPEKVLFVESSPGRFEDVYQFTQERDRIRAAVGADGRAGDAGEPHATMDVSATENLTQIKRRVRRTEWDVLHVSGLDTHQATWYLDSLYDELKAERPAVWKKIVDPLDRIRDGMILRESNVAELPVPYDDLASALIDAARPPSLVTLNLVLLGCAHRRERWSGRGARSRAGVPRRNRRRPRGAFLPGVLLGVVPAGGAFAISHAFVEAWQKMKSDRTARHRDRHLDGSTASSTSAEVAPRAGRAGSRRRRTHARKRGCVSQIRRCANCCKSQLEVPDEVNYSLLHNDRPLVAERLTLTKLVKEPLEDISVRSRAEPRLAELSRSAARSIVLDEPQLALAPHGADPADRGAAAIAARAGASRRYT